MVQAVESEMAIEAWGGSEVAMSGSDSTASAVACVAAPGSAIVVESHGAEGPPRPWRSQPWLVVVNPAAGRGRLRRGGALATAHRLASALGAEVAITGGPGDAGAIAAGAADHGGLAVVGGDGTIAEVVGRMDRARQTLLVVAAGTGNGLARDLGLARADDVLRALGGGRLAGFDVAGLGVASLDLARVAWRDADGWHSRLVVSSAGVGLVAEAVARAERLDKRFGPVGYATAAARQAIVQRPFEATVRLDDGPAIAVRLTNVMVNNTCHAGNFATFPGTDPADGRLRALLACATPAAQFAHAASVLTRTYVRSSGAEHEVERVAIALAEPAALMLDGELVTGVVDVRVEVLPGALSKVVVGRGWGGGGRR